MKQNEKNATLKAYLNAKGYVVLSLSVEGYEDIAIKVNDFGGKDSKKARKLAYALYKKVGA